MRCFRMFADNANRLKRQRQSWSSSRRGCLRNIRVNGESKSRVETTANTLDVSKCGRVLFIYVFWQY